jgi:P4 family phage/plasmid primase-like protien
MKSVVKGNKVGSPKTDDGLKIISPIIYRSEMAEPTISITRGLKSSDKNYVDIPLSQVQSYLEKNINCYERTLPTEKNESVLNRAYIDLDGYAGAMDESDFDELCDNIKAKLTFGIEYPIAMMEASQYGYEKDGLENKLSFRINFLKKHGSKDAIKLFVLDEMLPLITSLLSDDIKVVLDKDCEDMCQYLSVDTGVYNPKGRKMRMWNSNKDGECRPNKLVSDDNTIEDTLITYIPADSELLPEPVVEEPVTTPMKSETSSTTTETTNPVQEDVLVDNTLLVSVLGGLASKRCELYADWVNVGMILFNEGLTCDIWDNWSKQSKKYTKGACSEKWASFTKGKLTQATLWKWLKEDNTALFRELCPRRTDFWTLIAGFNHAETARYFYNLKPDAYTYHEALGWFQLLPSGAWKHYEKTPSGLMTDIWLTLKKVNKEHWDMLDPAKEEDQKKAKLCNKFALAIGTKSFVDGCVAFLPSNYNDDQLDKKMDESKHLFAFQDKVVDLDNNNEVRDIRPSDYVCLHTGYDYPTERFPATKKEIRKLLYSIWEDWEVVEYVLTILALQLHGTKKMEEFYVMTGRGGNGKGLLGEIIKRGLGDYYHTIPNTYLTKRSEKKDSPIPRLATAKGKRFVQAQEPEQDDKLQVGAIKEFTGGDEISARVLNKNPVVYVPQFGLWLQCNTIPKLNKLDGGIKRRMVIIYFPFQFVDLVTEPHHRPKNYDLKDKIVKGIEWRGEFIHMLLEKFQTIGDVKNIVKPKLILDHTDDYMAENDAVKSWLAENYTTNCDFNDRKFNMKAEDLRQLFIRETNTAPFDMAAAKFKTLMEMNGVPQKRESNPFNGFSCDDDGEYHECRMPAGSYYLGIKRKVKDEE